MLLSSEGELIDHVCLMRSYHLVNVLTHCICTMLVVPVASHLLGGDTLAAVVAAALFATHPIHTEAGTRVLIAVTANEETADLSCIFCCSVKHSRSGRAILHAVCTGWAVVSAALGSLGRHSHPAARTTSLDGGLGLVGGLWAAGDASEGSGYLR